MNQLTFSQKNFIFSFLNRYQEQSFIRLFILNSQQKKKLISLPRFLFLINIQIICIKGENNKNVFIFYN